MFPSSILLYLRSRYHMPRTHFQPPPVSLNLSPIPPHLINPTSPPPSQPPPSSPSSPDSPPPPHPHTYNSSVSPHLSSLLRSYQSRQAPLPSAAVPSASVLDSALPAPACAGPFPSLSPFRARVVWTRSAAVAFAVAVSWGRWGWRAGRGQARVRVRVRV